MPGWQKPILRWLADSGYDVDYCSGFDLHDHPDLLSAYRLLVCIGHDEYWTAQTRDTAEQLRRSPQAVKDSSASRRTTTSYTFDLTSLTPV
jgi:hypothetical protein